MKQPLSLDNDFCQICLNRLKLCVINSLRWGCNHNNWFLICVIIRISPSGSVLLLFTIARVGWYTIVQLYNNCYTYCWCFSSTSCICMDKRCWIMHIIIGSQPIYCCCCWSDNDLIKTHLVELQLRLFWGCSGGCDNRTIGKREIMKSLNPKSSRCV